MGARIVSNGCLVAGAVAVTLTAVAPGLAQERRDADEGRQRQRQIVMMEGVLTQAVRNGASGLVTQFRGSRLASAVDLMLSGAPETRGYQLDEYGVFFAVRVPGIRPAFAQALPDYVAAELQKARLADAQKRAVGASSLSVAASPPPPVAPVDAGLLTDPDGEYTRHVQTEIMNAMLENSQPLRLQPHEHLTVAARDDTPTDPLVPGDQSDIRTMTFTIKGSDLASYHEQRLSLEEGRKLIVIREH